MCDACVVCREHGVRRGLSVDRERGERLLRGLATSEGGVAGARAQPAAAAGAAYAAAAAGPGPAGLAADDAPLAARAHGGRAPPRSAALRQPAAHLHLRPVRQRVQAGGLPRPEGGGLHHPGRHNAVPAAGLRAVPEAPGGRAAHSVHEAKETGHSAAGVQRGAGAHPARAGRHPAGCQPLQAALVQGLRRAVPRLHHGKVRSHTNTLLLVVVTCVRLSDCPPPLWPQAGRLIS